MNTNLKAENFGTLPDGRSAQLFTLKNKNGAKAKVTNYGATLTELWVPNKSGQFANIVIGFDNLQEYLDCKCYYGATVGRYANRIGGGKFTLDGKEYNLPLNNKTCTLHGGNVGFDKMLWDAEQSDDHTVTFKHLSKHLDEGFPGNLTAKVTYTLSDDDRLEIEFQATTDQPTIVNLTNHAYFNLNGIGVGDILDHELLIHADHYVRVDDALIPTGELTPVAQSPFDFREFRTIRERHKEAGGGYDHNFCFRENSNAKAVKAELRASGRKLRIYATQPGLQIFTSHSFHELGDKSPYYDFSGIALETQHYPDSINQKNFPGDTILRPGEEYLEKYIIEFAPN
ncbi:MAG TPA: aldose epimerase family protein [Drouetiella sp.]|jgi:aldose 1-epimerase